MAARKKKRCPKGVVKTGPRKGKCRKIRRPLSGAAAGRRRRPARRRVTRRKATRRCKLYGMIQTASGAQRPACAQFSGRKHVEKLSGNWIPGAFMSAKIYREHKKEVRAQRKAMRAEAKIANASPFIGPIANPENMRRQAFMRAAAKNPF